MAHFTSIQAHVSYRVINAISSGPYAIRARAANPADKVPKNKGGHAYHPQQFKTIRAIFYAIGRDRRVRRYVGDGQRSDGFGAILCTYLKAKGTAEIPTDR
jgi:hypothetical protein